MSASRLNAWQLVNRGGDVSATDLLRAVAEPATGMSNDVRTRLLVRDAARALAKVWGEPVLRRRLLLLGAPPDLLDRVNGQDDEIGFPSLEHRTMETTNPDDVLSMLREPGRAIHQPVRLSIGGSIALIMDSLIVHATEDMPSSCWTAKPFEAAWPGPRPLFDVMTRSSKPAGATGTS